MGLGTLEMALRNHFLASLFVMARRAILCCFVLGISVVASAGIRGPGKYSGVVVFDRWDPCYLVSGPYVMYVASAEKERLRAYAGVAVEIEATDVFQPINPGDGLIKTFSTIALAPEPETAAMLDGLAFHVTEEFSKKSVVRFRINISNDSSSDKEIRMDEISMKSSALSRAQLS